MRTTSNDGALTVRGVRFGQVLDWIVVGLAVGVIARVAGCGSDNANVAAHVGDPAIEQRSSGPLPHTQGP